MSTASSIWFDLYISFKPASSHSLLHIGRCTFSLVNYTKYACAQQPQSALLKLSWVWTVKLGYKRYCLCLQIYHCIIELHWKNPLYFERSRQKQFFNLHFVFPELEKNSSNSVMLPLNKEKAFLYTTQNLRKPQMELEVKPPKKIIC